MIKLSNNYNVACDFSKGNCDKCNYSYLCEYYMKLTDNIPLISDNIYVGSITKKEYVKHNLKIL